ncbi:MAG: phosphate ABC transporter permease subunit PstC [Gloeomargaritaceae cyanobacterium C42_A2020_066]|nr:phosphate ABC transporter permease subunit PstC [Gloeomargaritaceae cyanobacterium C42_A2020_066]
MPEEKTNTFSALTLWVRWVNIGFIYLTCTVSVAVALWVLAIISVLIHDAQAAFHHFGMAFLMSSSWNPLGNNGQGQYGILPQIYGTLVSSWLALLIAVPLGFGVAIFLTERWPLVPPGLQTLLAFLVELLAAIPSVVYGIWGIYVLIPALVPLTMWLHVHFSGIGIFSQPPTRPSMLVAGLVLAIMILPTVTSLAREALAAVPPDLRQGSMALGATRWETLIHIILPTARSGLVGSIMLGLARAMGETMAVAMVIGNSNRINISILQPASTIPSLLANQFAEASGLQVSALMYAAFILLIITLLTNIFAEVLIGRH